MGKIGTSVGMSTIKIGILYQCCTNTLVNALK
jgi:hypothetical protein